MSVRGKHIKCFTQPHKWGKKGRAAPFSFHCLKMTKPAATTPSTSASFLAAEEAEFQTQITAVEQWWKEPRFAGVTRPYTAADGKEREVEFGGEKWAGDRYSGPLEKTPFYSTPLSLSFSPPSSCRQTWLAARGLPVRYPGSETMGFAAGSQGQRHRLTNLWRT